MMQMLLRFARALLAYAMRNRHASRSVEYLLAWIMFAWSARVILPGQVLVGPTYTYLLVVAPETVWGLIGVTVAVLRIYALIRNGAWKRSPALRLFGAALGVIWWLVLTVLFHIAIETGAPDFPMRAAYPVFIIFELYSCFRCGQDQAALSSKCGPRARPEITPAELPGHG